MLRTKTDFCKEYIDKCKQQNIEVPAYLTEMNEEYWTSISKAVDLAEENGITLLKLVESKVKKNEINKR